jgi:hypothetical protein
MTATNTDQGPPPRPPSPEPLPDPTEPVPQPEPPGPPGEPFPGPGEPIPPGPTAARRVWASFLSARALPPGPDHDLPAHPQPGASASGGTFFATLSFESG